MPTWRPDSGRDEAQQLRTRSSRTAIRAMRQLAAVLVTLFAVSALSFLATSFQSPDDIARAAIGRRAAPAQIDAFIRAHDLDAPLPQRYGRWASRFRRGDWGRSVITDRPIEPELMPRIGRTLLLVAIAFAVVVPLGIAVGAALAQRWGSRSDVAATSGLMVLSAFPEFVIGVGAIVVFSVWLRWLPPESATGLAFGGTGQQARAYVLPAITLVLIATPFLVRLTVASAREALVAPHTRAATFRGLPPRTVIWEYGMRSAAVPIVNAAGLTLVHLLGGTLVVENVLGFPGSGRRS
jgi:peptide/nickel transport system permease protein